MGILITRPIPSVPICRTLLARAAEGLCRHGSASTSLVARLLGCSHDFAGHVMAHLETEGVVGPADESGRRGLLYDKECKPIAAAPRAANRVNGCGTG